MTGTRTLACVGLAASILAGTAAAAYGGPQWDRLRKRVEQVQSLHISEGEEIRLGEEVSERIRVRYGVVQDVEVHRYVALVGTLLAQAGPRPNLPWHFIVLDTDGVNAFAAPGGYIHVTRGALGLVENEAELAAVLAHEIVHVTAKHTVEAVQKSKAIELGTSGLQDREVFARVADAATEIALAGFGRSEELESDREALRLVNRIGYSPKGLAAFLGRLAERNRESSGKQGLFASHPEMNERIEKLARQVTAERLASAVVLPDRYRRFIGYAATPQADVALAVEGAAGLAPAGQGQAAPPPKKKGIGLSRLLKPSGPERKSAEVTGSGASRGVDTERGARGGAVPTLVAVNLKPAEVAAFRAEGKLK